MTTATKGVSTTLRADDDVDALLGRGTEQWTDKTVLR